MDEQNKIESYETGKKWAIGLGVAVYLAAIVLVLTFSETVVTAKMDGFFRIVAQLALVIVAANSVAIPVALHYWAVTQWHRRAAVVAYAIDIIFLGINAVVAFSFIQGVMPQWASDYLPYIPLSAVVALAQWAVLYVLDPGAIATIRLAKAHQDAELAVVKQIENYLGSEQGQNTVIAAAAGTIVDEMFDPRRLAGKVTSKINMPQKPKAQEPGIPVEGWPANQDTSSHPTKQP